MPGLPTQVGNSTKDLCIVAFRKQMGDDITKKAFQIGVASMRAGEKYAVRVNFSCLCLSPLFFFFTKGSFFEMKSCFVCLSVFFYIKKWFVNFLSLGNEQK